MLLNLVELLRQFEEHCGTCRQCAAYYTAPLQFDPPEGACGIGRGLILRMLKVLNQGL